MSKKDLFKKDIFSEVSYISVYSKTFLRFWNKKKKYEIMHVKVEVN